MSNSLRHHCLCSSWNSPGQNTGVSGRSLLQGIFPTQGWNPGLPHCRQILYQLSHQGSPSSKGSLNNWNEGAFLPLSFSQALWVFTHWKWQNLLPFFSSWRIYSTGEKVRIIFSLSSAVMGGMLPLLSPAPVFPGANGLSMEKGLQCPQDSLLAQLLAVP